MKTFAAPAVVSLVLASVATGSALAADDEAAGYLPSRAGPVGLYNMSTAEVGPTDHLRLGLLGEFFAADSLVVEGDRDTRLATVFAVGYTPLRYLELFGSVTTSTNSNVRASEPGRGDPEVIKSWGDFRLGAKTAFAPAPGWGLGLELGLRLPPSTSTFAVAGSATSLWAGPLGTLDLRRINRTPLRFHASAGYYLDNSRNVSAFGDATTTTTRAVSMFAYGIAESRFRFALGIDAPLEKELGPVPLQPFVEYHAEIVTADADPAFADLMRVGGRDRHWLTFGLRARVYKGITLDAGADVRLRSTSVLYGPPLAPYDVVLGALYPLDIDAFTRPVVVTHTVQKEVVREVPPPATDGEISGTVSDRKAGKPLGAAVVALRGRAHARVVTDPDGTFRLGNVPPGPAQLDITAAAFEDEQITTAVTAGRTAEVTVSLAPRVMTGSVRGKVTDPDGHGIEAALHFAGAQSYDARSAPDGSFSATLVPGVYRVAVEAPALADKRVPFDVAVSQERQLDVAMHAPNLDVTLAGDAVTLRAPIKFRPGTPRLSPKDQAELDGVAALLDDHPEIRVLRVEAHWDSSAGLAAKLLTDRQAQAIKDYLTKKGVTDARVEVAGMGSEHPLAPTIGAANRTKNRRVELRAVY